MPLTPKEQFERFKSALEGRVFTEGSHSDLLDKCLDWVRKLPYGLTEDDRDEFKQRVCQSFGFSRSELDYRLGSTVSKSISVVERELTSSVRLEDLIPERGFVRDYVNYTDCCEAPLAYHVFCALAAIGATVNRRVWIDMGIYSVYPAMGVLILGPSGIKKTTATDITTRMLTELGTVKMYSEKLTPEALVEAMIGDATGMLYAPEMTVFLNKQKYNEGLVQLITRFMDCPDKWASGTIMRKTRALENIAISSLMCSTLDWFIRSTPEDTFGGGFIARNIMVVQETCDRIIPKPKPLSKDGRLKLVYQLAQLHANFQGEMTWEREAEERYEDWYRTTHQGEKANLEHEMLAAYHNRKPDHIKRLAICLHLASCGTMVLCRGCFDRALSLLNWTELYVPNLLKQMFKSAQGEEREQILRVIQSEGGEIRHFRLVSKMSYKMDASRVKAIIQSLKEETLVEEYNDNARGHGYRIRSERID